MLHPRLTPSGATLGGSSSVWLTTIGTYGAWSDLTITTRWGQGASGMYEAQWAMPLAADFEHPLLRRGTLIELMHSAYRVGSSLMLSEIRAGSGFDEPWSFVATGIGREAEGETSYYALDGSGNISITPSTAVDAAIARGLPWAGRGGSVPTSAVGASTSELQSLGSLLSAAGDSVAQRWGVEQDNIVRFKSDPTTPTYEVVPNAAALGTADDDYASVVLVRYSNSGAGGALATVSSPASASAVEQRYQRREFAVDLTSLGQISTSMAQSFADGILAKSKGRLAWTNGLTLTSNELLTIGGKPAPLGKVLTDVGTGCLVRLHGIWSDLLASTGQTYLDVIVGEAKYVAGAPTIDLNPLGLAPRHLAAVIESVTGIAIAA